MAEVSPFQVDRGDAQARIASTAIDGSYAYQLGHTSRITEYMEEGDYIELSQSAEFDFGVQKLVRLSVHLTPPDLAVANRAWEFTAALGAVVFYTRRLQPNGVPIVISDIALSLADAPAPPTTVAVNFRLTLVVA